MPRGKHIRTVAHGLWGQPTDLNNVETYANVPVDHHPRRRRVRRHRHRDVQGHQDLLAHRQGHGTPASSRCPWAPRCARSSSTSAAACRTAASSRPCSSAGPRAAACPPSCSTRPSTSRTSTKYGSMMGSGGMVVVDDDHLHGRLRQVLPRVHRRGELRQVRALPRRHAAHARDPRAHHRRHGHRGRRRAARAAQRRHHRGLAVPARRQRAQSRAHHAAVLPRRGHGARGREALPGQGLPAAHQVHHRRGRLHRLHGRARRPARPTRSAASASRRTSIDQKLCIKCDTCRQVCKFDAIPVVDAQPALVEGRQQ